MRILRENSLSLATVPRERTTSFSKREVNASASVGMRFGDSPSRSYWRIRKSRTNRRGTHLPHASRRKCVHVAP